MKTVSKFSLTEKASQSLRKLANFKKNQIGEMQSQVQKYEKYKSKNDIKTPLGPFNKDLRAISVFFSYYLVKL